jgi:phosphoribosylanthranilate isomerase
MVTRVKVCCIGSADEAALAVKYGVSALGLVSNMPSGPGIISEREIGKIVATVPPAIATFLLTSKQDPQEIVRQQQKCRVNTLQLVEKLPVGAHAHLRESLPGIALVQVIHVTGPESITEAQAVAREVDALLLDTGNHDLPTKVLGGTGRTHDWKISKEIVASVETPVFLAGGLTPTNVREAIDLIHPYGVDVCSGLRINGQLDESKLGEFMYQARAN